ncbi:hypothetical protein PoB_000292100 [Plakobranchus ocellatus]|uniref:Uncharacterized protein n=1 Tax=Plakobranchus ocellatus TaxID=259542 RepID=A0AAV3XET5_9GAST|nr:hypothetical protein PoB_000292100 [Plakobranchus ocellatus]
MGSSAALLDEGPESMRSTTSERLYTKINQPGTSLNPHPPFSFFPTFLKCVHLAPAIPSYHPTPIGPQDHRTTGPQIHRATSMIVSCDLVTQTAITTIWRVMCCSTPNSETIKGTSLELERTSDLRKPEQILVPGLTWIQVLMKSANYAIFPVQTQACALNVLSSLLEIPHDLCPSNSPPFPDFIRENVTSREVKWRGGHCESKMAAMADDSQDFVIKLG